MAFDHAGENVAEICEGFDAIELAGFDEGGDDGPAFTAAITSCEEMVFATQCGGTDGAFDRIGVEIDMAIIKEPGKAIPSGEGIAHGFSKFAASGKTGQLVVQPLMQPLDQWALSGPAL